VTIPLERQGFRRKACVHTLAAVQSRLWQCPMFDGGALPYPGH
jgi:hypothetical protein